MTSGSTVLSPSRTMIPIGVSRIEFISSVGTLGKDDPEDFQVCSFGLSTCCHLTWRPESHSVLPRWGISGRGWQYRGLSLVRDFRFPNEHFALVLLVNSARARVHQYACRQG